MPLRGCTVVAHYRQRGVHVEGPGEPARTSPFVEEIVVHGKGCFDLVTGVDLFAAQLTALLRTARHHTLVIADKTVATSSPTPASFSASKPAAVTPRCSTR